MCRDEETFMRLVDDCLFWFSLGRVVAAAVAAVDNSILNGCFPRFLPFTIAFLLSRNKLF